MAPTWQRPAPCPEPWPERTYSDFVSDTLNAVERTERTPKRRVATRRKSKPRIESERPPGAARRTVDTRPSELRPKTSRKRASDSPKARPRTESSARGIAYVHVAPGPERHASSATGEMSGISSSSQTSVGFAVWPPHEAWNG